MTRNRRHLLRTGLMAGASILAAPALVLGADDGPFPHAPLPYETDALAPVISQRTVELHHGLHHAGYHRSLNRLVAGTEYADMPLHQVLRATLNHPEAQAIFNNAGQAWNHFLYWQQMIPGGARTPSGRLASALDAHFGGFDAFKDAFVARSAQQFGSGWVWLVDDEGVLSILTTSNGSNPVAYGARPIIGIDVWEHAYYLDYQNRRIAHVRAVLDELIDWEMAGMRLAP